MPLLIFLFIDTSLLSKKFLATCWVMVEAPTSLFHNKRVSLIKLGFAVMLTKSTPLCL